MNELWRLLRLFKPYWGWMLLSILLSLATLLANVTLLAISGWFIASMAVAGAAGASMNYFTPAAIIRACAIIRTVGRYVERLVSHEATFRLLAQLRSWFYQYLEPLAPAYLQQYRSGDLLSRIRADIDTLDHFYLRVLAPVAVALLAGLVVFFFVSRYSEQLAWINLLFLLLAGVAVPALMQRLGAAPGRRSVAYRAEMQAAVVDGVQGMAELMVYGASEAHARQLNDNSRQLITEQERLSHYNALSLAAMNLSTNLAVWFVLLFAIPLVTAAKLENVELAMLALFTLASFEAVMALPSAFAMLGQSLAAARRIFEITDTKPLIAEPVQALPRPQNFGLQIHNVHFRYTDDRPWALQGIGLDLPEGSRIAIIGATGSGKTSLVNLLLRFWQAQHGKIMLGGHELQRYSSEDIRSCIGVVSQHTHLFNATIRQNLLLAKPNATQQELETATQTAQIHDFIGSQPDGYDTWVGEAGVRLSGGQARRIAIARALLKDAPILILDEPTEGLDAPTERELMQAIDRLMQGRSVLLITHRLIGLETMDKVLVMEQGRIVERGTHAELLSSGKVYRRFHSLLADVQE